MLAPAAAARATGAALHAASIVNPIHSFKYAILALKCCLAATPAALQLGCLVCFLRARKGLHMIKRDGVRGGEDKN